MKQLFVFFVSVLIGFSSFAQAGDDEILMQIANDKVTVAEFLHVYKKNNQVEGAINQSDLLEYLDLYVNFRLKVKEAMDLGMDTSASFKKELSGYRSQLAQPYFVDESINEQLLEEAYERLQYDIRASHILIKLAQDAEAADTLLAYNTISNIRNRIIAGEDFAEVAVKESQDPSARDMAGNDYRPARKGNQGDLGYFTVFDMVYNFESGAYETPVGDVSEIIKTQFGYHIVKVTDKKPAMGTVTVAHIFIAHPKDATEENNEAAKAKIFEAYEKLNQGEAFETVVTEYSEDKGSAGNGGQLPKFGVNRMVPEFISTIGELENPGDISEPVETSYGWHIIKLVSADKPGTFEEEKANLSGRIAKDNRASLSEEAIISKIKKEYKFKEYPKTKEAIIDRIDSTLLSGTWDPADAADMNKAIFKLDDIDYTQKDFAGFLASKQHNRIQNIRIFFEETYDDFVNQSCLDYEDSKLEEKYPEFKLLVQEYHDGILLFDLTDDRVWSQAVKDTLGLQGFYEANKGNYMWGKRVKGVIYNVIGPDFVDMEEIMTLVKSGTSDEDILSRYNNDSTINVLIEPGLYEKGSSDIIDQVKWKTGISKMVDTESGYAFVFINQIVKPQPKKIDEARGLITADYQTELEKKWIEELKLKYPVSINQDVLTRIK